MTRPGEMAVQKIAADALALLRSGEFAKALDDSDKGLRAHPNHPALLKCKGLAAMHIGDAMTAEIALMACLTQEANQPGLWEILGGAQEALGHHDDALRSYDQAIKHGPSRSSAHQLKGTLLVRLYRFEEGNAALERALAINDKNVQALFWRGMACYSNLELDEAEALFNKVIELDPNWGKARVQLASVVADFGRYQEALQHFKKGLELCPDDSNALRLFAQILIEIQNDAEAERMLKKALALDPDDAMTLANLANMYERQNRMDAAADAANRALKHDPNNNLALKVVAILEHRRGDPEKALAQMQDLSKKANTWREKESTLFELAHLHEKLGNIDKAFAAFSRANAIHRESAASRKIDPKIFHDQVAREAQILKENPPQDTKIPKATDPPDPVFLMGFPRSGTTLMDQVLDSHPEVVVMEERPPLAEVYKRITDLELASGKVFTALDSEQRSAARQFYFQRVQTFAPEIGTKVFIDKHPLATAKIRIIKLLFPHAKIIFALRHPCDVVLSCFMQPFKVNIASVNFYSLEETTKIYQLVMDLWQQNQQQLGLPIHYVHYEDLVKAFEDQVKQVLDFLGLDWNERLTSFHQHAQSRDLRTASSRQVTQPLYKTALARWQRYKKHLNPHILMLQPYIDAFGYSSDKN